MTRFVGGLVQPSFMVLGVELTKQSISDHLIRGLLKHHPGESRIKFGADAGVQNTSLLTPSANSNFI